MLWVRLVGVCGFNTLTSRYEHCLSLSQKPWTLTSSLKMLTSTLAVLCGSISVVSGWRGSSTSTFVQTSESSWAVKSWIWLWWIEGKPPIEQLKAWWTGPYRSSDLVVCLAPIHSGHRVHLWMPACVGRNHVFLIGMVDRHADAPFLGVGWQEGSSRECWMAARSVCCRAVASSCYFSLWCLL